MRPRSWVVAIALCTLAAALACSSSEPSDPSLELPDLVYAERDEASSLWSIYGYTDGEGAREIAPGQAGLPRPAFDFLRVRPTTGELLYVSDNPDHLGYVLLNPGSGVFRHLALPGAVQDWSPSGDLLTTYDGAEHLVVDLEGVVRQTVCGPPLTCGVPEWEPSSDAIVVFRQPAESQADLWRVPLTGGSAVNLTQTIDAHEIGPSYSPDGQHLVYQRQPNHELVVSNADGSGVRTLLPLAGLGNFPWSPDGLSVAVDASVGDQFGLTIVPLQGSPRVITPPGERLVVVSQIAWSPDGNRLAYGAFDGTPSDRPGVFVINVDGSGRQQLNRPGNAATDAAWIPDLR